MPAGRRTTTRTGTVLPARVLGALAAGTFAGWEGFQGRYSVASHSSVLCVIGAVLLLTLAAGRGAQRMASRDWLRRLLRTPRWTAARWRRAAPGSAVSSPEAFGWSVWGVLIAATILWDVASFVAQAHSLPTLSRLFGTVTDHDWGRALVFAAWLALGLYLAVGARRGAAEHGRGPGRLPDSLSGESS